MKPRYYALLVLVLPQLNLSAQAPPSYAKQVRPVMAKYCFECHNAKALKGGLNLETFKAMLEGAEKGPVLIAGKPDESLIVTSLEGKTKPAMPPQKAKSHPKVEEVALIRAWVRSGARDDGSLIKVVIPNIKPRHGTVASVTSVAYDPAGRFLAVAKHNVLEIVDLKTGIVVEESQPGHITALAINAAGTSLAVAFGSPGAAHGIMLRGIGAAPPKTRSFPNLHQDAILDIAFSPDGELLASCSYDMRIKLTPLTPDTKPARTLKEHSDAVYAVAFSPDGKRLASCSADRAVKVWDVAGGKLLYTLGDATDWLYTLAFSPDGKHLASGGVDKSIRVYEVGADGAKVLQSVFAHEAPVQKIVYSRDGKTLYSLGQDRVLKAWDAQRMVEMKTYDRLPETGLCLALRAGELAVGCYDGVTQLIDATTGTSKPLSAMVNRFPTFTGTDENNSPGTGQLVKLPASVVGKLGKAGDVAYYRFQASRGQQLGVQLLTKEIKSKIEPYLQLTDERGNVLLESTRGYLGYTFAEAGIYAIGVRDQDFRGGPDMHYRLDLGQIPIVMSVFPLGMQRGTQADVAVQGVFLGAGKAHVEAPMKLDPGSKVAVSVSSPWGKPLGMAEVVVGEYPEMSGPSGMIPVPGTANGQLMTPGQRDTWKITAKKGQRLVLETEARRLGSALDSVLEVLDTHGQPVPSAVLRCQAKTFVTFRDHDSATPNIRIESWGALAVNDLFFVGGELMKIREMPTHPDADCTFFSADGRRRGYLDTTPTHHAMNEPMYKVSVHPPGTTFPPNGYPVFTLPFRNDDGGPGYGHDSRILFDPPADGDYVIRVSDARGQGGANFGYRLTARPPRPSFTVRFSPTNPAIALGGASSIRVDADRLDGYDGPINVHFESLPIGFSAPPTMIEAGQTSTSFALYADKDAKAPASASPLQLVAEATIAGAKVRKEALGETPKTIGPGDIVTVTEQAEITVQPGRQVKLTVHIERRNGFHGRVPLDVRGLPHGVRVIDIGLNGILINENEVRREVAIYAEPWVEPASHPFVVLARHEGKNTEYAAKSVILKVAK